VPDEPLVSVSPEMLAEMRLSALEMLKMREALLPLIVTRSAPRPEMLTVSVMEIWPPVRVIVCGVAKKDLSKTIASLLGEEFA